MGEQIGRTPGEEKGGLAEGTELDQLVLGKRLLGGQLRMVTWAPRALERGRGKITQGQLEERSKKRGFWKISR